MLWKYLQFQIVNIIFQHYVDWWLIVMINDENNILATSKVIKTQNVFLALSYVTIKINAHDDATDWRAGNILAWWGWILTMKVSMLQNEHDFDPFCWICKAVSWISIAFLETGKHW